ncbi:unnamed protein product [Ambrosiozyma monospora]|uniref:Unnamed protein product n=1 Tax=Ambrosiozyma monospora TaxID=43982 RepID=A0ACB5TAM9_AMBMO|nr:unnamed protein product [Ambrosiozyma monospora]
MKYKKKVIKEFHYPVVYQRSQTVPDTTRLMFEDKQYYRSSNKFWWEKFSIIKPNSAKNFMDILIRRNPKVKARFMLQVTSDIPKVNDITKGVEQIPVSFKVPDVKKIKDFIIDNQSTTLGRVMIDYIDISRLPRE